MNDDPELLRQYVQEGSESAFAALVQRHVGFVYAAALRQLGGATHRAEEITQIVFVALARKARTLSGRRELAGWLYTTTHYACAKLKRTEQRRQQRELEALTMNETISDAEVSAAWDLLRPMLDEAMHELNASERELILVRFFQGRRFADVGRAFGLSENTARMRVERALGKLRVVLARREIKSTTAALGLVLVSQTAIAVPANLGATITGAALASASTAGVGSALVIFYMKTKTAITIGAAVLAVGFATHEHLEAKKARAEATTLAHQRDVLRHQLRELQPRVASMHRGSSNASRGRQAATAQPVEIGQLHAETAAALQEPKVTEKYFALMSILQRLSADNWREVLAAFAEERKLTGLAHPEAFEMFVRRAGEVAGKDATGHFLESSSIKYANDALMGWASKNPSEALQWLGRADPNTRRSVLGAAIRGLALSEPDLAIKTLEELPANDRKNYTDELVTSMLRGAGLDATQRLVEGMITRAAATRSLKEDYIKSVFYDYALLRISQSAASGTMPDAVQWLNQHVGQPYVDHRVIAAATERLASLNPEETFRWLEGVNTTLLRGGDDSTAGYRVLLNTWARKDGAQVVEAWLQTQIAHPHYDHMAYQYTALLAGQNPTKAVQWADSIKNNAIRKNAVELINNRATARKKA